MKAPACDPGDCCIALGAESALFIPEIAKSAGTPERFHHVSPFAFFEVGFIGWIVRVSFAFDLDVPFDGSALGVVQPDFSRPSSTNIWRFSHEFIAYTCETKSATKNLDGIS